MVRQAGKVSETEYGNKCTYYPKRGLSQPQSAIIEATNLDLFLLEAKNLPSMKVSGYCEVTLFLKNKNNILETTQRSYQTLNIRKLKNTSGYKGNCDPFKNIELELGRNSFDKETELSFTILLKSSTIEKIEVLGQVNDIWKALNHGVYLKHIAFDKYCLTSSTLPQLHRLRNLTTLSLAGIQFQGSNINFHERKLFRTMSECNLKSFVYSQQYDRSKKRFHVVGMLVEESFTSVKNFQQLFNFGVTRNRCLFGISLVDAFSQEMCKLFFTKLMSKIKGLQDYSLPWIFFKEEAVLFVKK